MATPETAAATPAGPHPAGFPILPDGTPWTGTLPTVTTPSAPCPGGLGGSGRGRPLDAPELEARYEGWMYGSENEPDEPISLGVETCVDLLEIFPASPGEGPDLLQERDGGREKGVTAYREGLDHDALVAHFEEQQHEGSTKPRLRILFLGNQVVEPEKTQFRFQPTWHSYDDLPMGTPTLEGLVPPPPPPQFPSTAAWQGKNPESQKEKDGLNVHTALHPRTAEFLSSPEGAGLGVSRAFWAVLLWKTFILKTGNCVLRRRVRCTESGREWDEIEGWYRYSCGLKSQPSHVWFSYTPDTTTYIVNNTKGTGVQDRILRCALGSSYHLFQAPRDAQGVFRQACGEGVENLLRPLAVDAFIAEATTYAWGRELLVPRLALIAFEHMDPRKRAMTPSEALRELHVLSYNLHIIKEDMEDHTERLEYLLGLHKTILEVFPELDRVWKLPSTSQSSTCPPPQGVPTTKASAEAFPSTSSPDTSPLKAGPSTSPHPPATVLALPPALAPAARAKTTTITTVPTSSTFAFLLSETTIHKRWAHNYTARTGIQTNLFYSLSAQKDNRTNLKIAEFTSQIARETQKDSSSMITMATMTMLFLPGTFVSAVFSMVFFDAGEANGSVFGVSVSPGAWLFPAITLPLTVLVFVIWNAWRVRRNRRHVEEVRDDDHKHRLFSAGYTTHLNAHPQEGQQLHRSYDSKPIPPQVPTMFIPASPPAPVGNDHGLWNPDDSVDYDFTPSDLDKRDPRTWDLPVAQPHLWTMPAFKETMEDVRFVESRGEARSNSSSSMSSSMTRSPRSSTRRPSMSSSLDLRGLDRARRGREVVSVCSS